MATRSMSTDGNQQHLDRNSQVIRRSTIMDCGDGMTDHNSTLQRSVSRHVDPPNYQNQYQWRASVKTQPPKTILHPSVLVRPHPQNKQPWRNPEASKVLTQAFKQEREIPHFVPMQTSKEQLKDQPYSVIPEDIISNPTASGSGLRLQSIIAQPSIKNNEKYDRRHYGRFNGPNYKSASSREISRNHQLPVRQHFGGVSPLNRPEASAEKDGGWGINQNRQNTDIFPHSYAFGREARSGPCFVEQSYHIKQPSRFDEGRLRDKVNKVNNNNSNNNRLFQNKGLEKISPLNRSTSEGFGKVSPMNRHEHHVRIDGGWGTDQIKNYPIPGLSQFNPWAQTNSEEKLKLEERVSACLNLFVEKPWSVQDIEDMRRLLSYKTTPVPPEPSLEGLEPEALVYVEPVKWLSDKVNKWLSGKVNNNNSNNNRLSRNTGFGKISPLNPSTPEGFGKVSPLTRFEHHERTDGGWGTDQIRKYPVPGLSLVNPWTQIGTTSKVTKLNAPKRINRKRKVCDDDNMDRDMAPRTKRSRLM